MLWADVQVNSGLDPAVPRVPLALQWSPTTNSDEIACGEKTLPTWNVRQNDDLPTRNGAEGGRSHKRSCGSGGGGRRWGRFGASFSFSGTRGRRVNALPESKTILTSTFLGLSCNSRYNDVPLMK